MNDVKRLFESDATAFEQALLDYGRSETVPEHLVRQMELGLGISAPAAPLIATSKAGAWLKAGVAGKAWLLGALSLGLAAGVYLVKHNSGAQQVESLPGTAEPVAVRGVQFTEPVRDQIQPRVSVLPASKPEQQAVLDIKSEPNLPSATPETAPPAPARLNKPALRNANAKAHSGNEASQLQTRLELQLLDPARAALARGDFPLAARLLSDYERRFPNGILQREAGVLRASLSSRSARETR